MLSEADRALFQEGTDMVQRAIRNRSDRRVLPRRRAPVRGPPRVLPPPLRPAPNAVVGFNATVFRNFGHRVWFTPTSDVPRGGLLGLFFCSLCGAHGFAPPCKKLTSLCLPKKSDKYIIKRLLAGKHPDSRRFLGTPKPVALALSGDSGRFVYGRREGQSGRAGGGLVGHGQGDSGGLCNNNGGSVGVGVGLDGFEIGGGQSVVGETVPQPANGGGGLFLDLCPEVPCGRCGVWFRPVVGVSCHSRCASCAGTGAGARASSAVGDLQDDQRLGVEDQSPRVFWDELFAAQGEALSDMFMCEQVGARPPSATTAAHHSTFVDD